MSDLVVVAVITAKQGSEQVVREALVALVTPTRNEEGCLSYELYQSSNEPTVFVTQETWRSGEDLDAHMTTPHIAATLEAAGDHLATAPAIHRLDPIPVD